MLLISNMDQIIEKTVKQLNRTHLIVIATLVVLQLAVMFVLFSLTFDAKETGVVAERYAIGITLIAIPLSLKLFADKTKKITVAEYGRKEKIRRFRNTFIMRISILGTVGLANILFYALTQNSNFMWLAVITFIAFVFCKTSVDELNGLLAEEEMPMEENENE